MSRKRANLTDLLNNLTFKVLYNKFKLVAMNAFKWEGLPEGIEERHIEEILFDKGFALFFRDPDMDFMCLPARSNGQVNVNGDPLGYIAYGINYQHDYDLEQAVVIPNNKLLIATEDFVMFYVNKLAEIERTMDVNVKACKTPIIFACDSNDVLSLKTVFQKVDGNVPAIFADRNLNLDAISVFDTKAKFLGLELRDLGRGVEGDLLTFLGKNNVPIEKKERVNTHETDANNDLIESFFDLQLEAREAACEQINEIFKLSVSVKPRQAVQKAVETVDNSEGGDE